MPVLGNFPSNGACRSCWWPEYGFRPTQGEECWCWRPSGGRLALPKGLNTLTVLHCLLVRVHSPVCQVAKFARPPSVEMRMAVSIDPFLWCKEKSIEVHLCPGPVQYQTVLAVHIAKLVRTVNTIERISWPSTTPACLNCIRELSTYQLKLLYEILPTGPSTSRWYHFSCLCVLVKEWPLPTRGRRWFWKGGGCFQTSSTFLPPYCRMKGPCVMESSFINLIHESIFVVVVISMILSWSSPGIQTHLCRTPCCQAESVNFVTKVGERNKGKWPCSGKRTKATKRMVESDQKY